MTTVLHSPRVYLLAHSEIRYEEYNAFRRDHGIANLPDAYHDLDSLPEVAGRLCYMSFDSPRPGENEAYLAHIKESGHGSVLEHASWSFLFTGVSRSLTHELVRHRAGMAYSQLSQRYVDESVAEYVCPPEYDLAVRAGQLWHGYAAGHDRTHEEIEEQIRKDLNVDKSVTRDEVLILAQIGMKWVSAVETAHVAYMDLVELTAELIEARIARGAEGVASKRDVRKRVRGSARSVLPNATETKIVASFNTRSLRHFLEMRAHPAADLEIRRLAVMVHDKAVAAAPNSFADYRVVTLGDGTGALETDTRKV